MKEQLTSPNFPFMSDDSFHSCFNSITEGVLFVNKEGKIILSNLSAEKMFGYDAVELQGMMVENLIPSHLRLRHAEKRVGYFGELDERVMGEGKELSGLRKDGAQFPVEVKLSNHEDRGEILITVSITDISVRKSIERKLVLEKERAQLYFDAAEVILLVLDLKGNIMEINREGCELLGYSQEELKGRNWFEVSIQKENEMALNEVFAGVLAQGEEYQTYDNLVMTKKKEERMIHWRNTVIRDEDGEVSGTLSSGIDITEKHRMIKELEESQEKLKDYSENLEKQVECRTRALEESLMKERDLSELKSKFVSLASHEFRTPLSTILSSASLIAKYTGEGTLDKRMKHVNRIKSSVAHLSGILEDFLSVDRLDSGKISCNPEVFELEEVAQEVVNNLEGIKKPGQVIDLTFKGEKRCLNTDKKLVRNILVNLASNAIKYSPEDKSISIAFSLDQNNMICEIKDEGIGIPEEDHKHLFQQFFRASNTAGFNGTGLGLNIVKRYVDLLNGEIDFASTRGKGTTFTIKFPLEWQE